MKKYYCIKCRSELEKSDNYCRSCGRKNIYWTPDDSKHCPNCDALLLSEENKCPICGFKVKGDHNTHDMIYEIYGPPEVFKK